MIEARNGSEAFFQIGFNRRFAAMAVAARDRLAATNAPKVVLLRVNAGQLPAQSWQKAPEEGHGRILGEVCHFVDLARFLIGAPIATIHAAAARATRDVCDDLTTTLTFSDGSLATIAYTAKGDTAFSKELVECYAGGTVFVIDNFRTATLISDGKEKSAAGSLDQDKGHAAQLATGCCASTPADRTGWSMGSHRAHPRSSTPITAAHWRRLLRPARSRRSTASCAGGARTWQSLRGRRRRRRKGAGG